MKYVKLLVLFLGGLPFCLSGQVLKGYFWDETSQKALEGVQIRVFRSNSTLKTNTASDGTFRFEGLKPGYYVLKASLIGYDPKELTEIDVVAGKERVLSISLRPADQKLPELLISGNEPGRRLVQPLGEIPLTREQTLRYPAMFYDPGRLAAAYPGVSTTDDGTNGMSIRGNNPATVRWRLEGVDIVNPNHLPNAGIFSDRPAAASGGVLMFSTQMLDNSSLLNGAYPPGYGDAYGGMMDMNLRQGNRDQAEFTVQASLVGLDVAAEGPLGSKEKDGKQSRNSYLANYRYSTVGLLGQLGVSFGDEQINFQDFSFHLFHEGAKGGRLSFFGMGGLSENLFKHKQDTSTIKHWKDYFDIDFHSKTGLVGASYSKTMGKTFIKAVLLQSAQSNFREDSHSEQIVQATKERLQELKSTASLSLTHRLNASFQLSEGLQVLRQELSLKEEVQDSIRTESFVSLQPWLNLKALLWDKRFELQAGIHSFYVQGSYDFRPEPRLLLSWRFNSNQRVCLSLVNQRGVSSLFVLPGGGDLTESWQFGAKYSWSPNGNWRLSAEYFDQVLWSLPVSTTQDTGQLIYNALPDRFIEDRTLNFNGEVINKGFEFAVQRFMGDSWFLNANASFFRSRGRIGEDAKALPTRWDIRHVANLSLGREWRFSQKSSGNVRFLGVNGHMVWSGAIRERPIDLSASQDQLATVYVKNSGFTQQNPDYSRIDLRVYWKRNIGNLRNSLLALDLQNVSNRQNIAYHYYDPFTKAIETKYQLGLIPNLSWKLEF